MSENRVYYGEYSLKHWIDLMLKKNIVLPPYQRLFVWDEDKVKALMQTFKNNFFIPPVTIGRLKGDGNESACNLIIDGQQRLTSVLLYCLGVFPKKDSFQPRSNDAVDFADDNDDIPENIETDEQKTAVLGWRFDDLLEESGGTLETIRKNLKDDKRYNQLETEITVDDKFLETHYLGFSYLIPNSDQQKYFSSVFRHINISGKALSPLESRKSLYFLKDDFDDFFDPECIRGIFIRKGAFTERIDFVRYLACTFQVKKQGGVGYIVGGYGRDYEAYYEDFIYSVVNDAQDSQFCPYQPEYKDRLSKLKEILEKIGLNKRQFESIIDADFYLFGLVYFVVLEGKQIDGTRKDELFNDLEKAIDECKNNPETGERHKKTPSALKYLRFRIWKSIAVYENYVYEQTQ